MRGRACGGGWQPICPGLRRWYPGPGLQRVMSHHTERLVNGQHWLGHGGHAGRPSLVRSLARGAVGWFTPPPTTAANSRWLHAPATKDTWFVTVALSIAARLPGSAMPRLLRNLPQESVRWRPPDHVEPRSASTRPSGCRAVCAPDASTPDACRRGSAMIST